MVTKQPVSRRQRILLWHLFTLATTNGAIYAIWVDQGKFYRGINVREAAERQARAAGPIPAINGHMGRDIRYQSVVNQQEHVLQSAASRQIIGWYTIVRGNDVHLHWVYGLFSLTGASSGSIMLTLTKPEPTFWAA